MIFSPKYFSSTLTLFLQNFSGLFLIRFITSFGLKKSYEATSPSFRFIIPSYNRYNYLLNAVNSVKKQTYKNIELIVVNDCSTQHEYYTDKILNNTDIIILKLKNNTKKKIWIRLCWICEK